MTFAGQANSHPDQVWSRSVKAVELDLNNENLHNLFCEFCKPVDMKIKCNLIK